MLIMFFFFFSFHASCCYLHTPPATFQRNDAAGTQITKFVPNHEKLLCTWSRKYGLKSEICTVLFCPKTVDIEKTPQQQLWSSHSTNMGPFKHLHCQWGRICTSNRTSPDPPDESIHDSIYAVSTLLVTQKQIKSIPSASNKVMITLWLWHLRQPLAKSAQNSLLTLFITSHNDPIQRQRGPASAQGPGNNPLH